MENLKCKKNKNEIKVLIKADEDGPRNVRKREERKLTGRSKRKRLSV